MVKKFFKEFFEAERPHMKKGEAAKRDGFAADTFMDVSAELSLKCFVESV